ncbi:MAG: hypothetical protein QM831_42170 [Kofleriaceae bacterium]
MARVAAQYRPPYLSLVALFATMLFIRPAEVVVTSVPVEPMRPTPTCIVEGEWHGDLLVPKGHWTMPILTPKFQSDMPILGYDEKLIDVDQLIDALKQWAHTPHS